MDTTKQNSMSTQHTPGPSWQERRNAEIRAKRERNAGRPPVGCSEAEACEFQAATCRKKAEKHAAAGNTYRARLWAEGAASWDKKAAIAKAGGAS